MTTKEKINTYIAPYKGSFKTLKQKNLIKVYGQSVIQEITDSSSFLPPTATLQERCYCIISDITETRKCIVCGTPLKIKSTAKNGDRYGITCSYTCGGKNTNTQDKKRQTNLQKYGNTNVLNSAEVVKKREAKLLETVGTTNYFTSQTYKDRLAKGDFKEARVRANKACKESMILFGYNRVIEEVNKNDIDPNFTIEQYKGHFNHYKWKCKKCSTCFIKWLGSVYDIICPSCNHQVGTDIERQVEEFLTQNKIIYHPRTRTTLGDRRQLDFYIPEKKIAIEVNGLFWHQDTILDKNYHLQKLEDCNKLGIKLIQIFSDEIKHKQNVVESRLKQILGVPSTNVVYARECDIVDVDHETAVKLYEVNHIQGNVNSRINIGLKFKDQIVAIMSFTSLRPVTGETNLNKDVYELTRYCTILNYNAPGGFSRLLTQFIRQYKPTYIKSYCDRRWSEGQVYVKNGFKLIRTTKPNYWYVSKDCQHRLHRYNFQKHLLSEKLEIFDPNLTEYENMRLNKYWRIWDCGHFVFELKIDQQI